MDSLSIHNNPGIDQHWSMYTRNPMAICTICFVSCLESVNVHIWESFIDGGEGSYPHSFESKFPPSPLEIIVLQCPITVVSLCMYIYRAFAFTGFTRPHKQKSTILVHIRSPGGHGLGIDWKFLMIIIFILLVTPPSFLGMFI